MVISEMTPDSLRYSASTMIPDLLVKTLLCLNLCQFGWVARFSPVTIVLMPKNPVCALPSEKSLSKLYPLEV